MSDAFTELEWKRVSEIFDKPLIFAEELRSKDIIRGALPNNYLLTVLSEMIEKPN